MANVLIVEDSKSVAAAHAYSLWEFGHTVTFAYNAREATEAFQATQHEVVLLDFDLPDATGLDVFRALRQVDPDACVVMVTGKGNERLASQILKEGANDYLTKTSELLKILPEVVDRVLKERQTRTQLSSREEELKLAHETLRQKVDELARANEKLENTLAELGRSQSQMLQSEKLASVGQLAAGVAHEINNPIGFISSNLFTLQRYFQDIQKVATGYAALRDFLRNPESAVPASGPVLEICSSIDALEEETDLSFILSDCGALIAESREGAERIKSIVADMKNFAHPGKKTLEYVDINANLESTINLVWHEIKYKAEVCKYFEELPLVRCYPQLISQVFMNLLVNAVQAMARPGVISLRTRISNGRAIVQIQDTGEGIAEDHLKKIFDPFFTTKPVGKGTGLGLKVVYDIIKKHDGDIEAHSTLGEGTEFIIRLPIEGPAPAKPQGLP